MSDKGKICLHKKYPGDDLLFLAANYNKSVLSPTVTSRTDSELENKVKKTSERICENLHIIANEPSLAFYRIAEHVRKVRSSISWSGLKTWLVSHKPVVRSGDCEAFYQTIQYLIEST